VPSYEGSLELSWTNKHLRLLAHEDGSYEWLDPSDYRVAEIRLLHDLDTVGQVSRTRAVDNLLIRGDALHALTSLARLPEFSCEYLGKVKLAYLDPPFNTGQAFEHYDDALEHSVWLTMMRDRLVQIWQLLAPDGSVWLHLDDSEAAYARVMMDEIFGRQNFVASMVWQRTTGTRKTDIANSHDYISCVRQRSFEICRRL
jgi:adenine-specific DNA-methyltransferase